MPKTPPLSHSERCARVMQDGAEHYGVKAAKPAVAGDRDPKRVRWDLSAPFGAADLARLVRWIEEGDYTNCGIAHPLRLLIQVSDMRGVDETILAVVSAACRAARRGVFSAHAIPELFFTRSVAFRRARLPLFALRTDAAGSLGQRVRDLLLDETVRAAEMLVASHEAYLAAVASPIATFSDPTASATLAMDFDEDVTQPPPVCDDEIYVNEDETNVWTRIPRSIYDAYAHAKRVSQCLSGLFDLMEQIIVRTE
jgi:hypothetical protein